MANRGNEVLSGTDGTVWVNGEEWAEVKALEAKVTGEFEDINFCGDYNTYKRFMGRTGEGTITLLKTSSRGAKIMAQAFKTGVMPEIKIVTKLTNKQTGKSERAVIKDIVFSEFNLAKFENRSIVEEELPFTFSDYDYIEMI
ncbi:phage tail tube protein [Paenibacillus sp. ACRRX]|uniref:phage tail tube protein n=1 Tax=Paenibacillus sp. ACRRX TaxID=2918206 RepID=UPI001EF40237|nr:phage tail tube protein [Paenibacillus sp. ACRRX]MCG7410576.1 phage tail tube protein [Paenibacillus sp. ACRRX]